MFFCDITTNGHHALERVGYVGHLSKLPHLNIHFLLSLLYNFEVCRFGLFRAQDL
jgi:hypothetical protein